MIGYSGIYSPNNKKNQESIAEAKFLRAWAYFDIANLHFQFIDIVHLN